MEKYINHSLYYYTNSRLLKSKLSSFICQRPMSFLDEDFLLSIKNNYCLSLKVNSIFFWYSAVLLWVALSDLPLHVMTKSTSVLTPLNKIENVFVSLLPLEWQQKHSFYYYPFPQVVSKNISRVGRELSVGKFLQYLNFKFFYKIKFPPTDFMANKTLYCWVWKLMALVPLPLLMPFLGTSRLKSVWQQSDQFHAASPWKSY